MDPRIYRWSYSQYKSVEQCIRSVLHIRAFLPADPKQCRCLSEKKKNKLCVSGPISSNLCLTTSAHWGGVEAEVQLDLLCSLAPKPSLGFLALFVSMSYVHVCVYNRTPHPYEIFIFSRVLFLFFFLKISW